MKNSYFVTVNGKSAIYRILAEEGDSLLVVEMDVLHLPYWINNAQAAPTQYNGTACAVLDELNNGQLATAHRRFTMIAGILPVIGDGKAMSKTIKEAAEKYGVSIPTVRKYLCLYLQAQDIAALVGVRQTKKASTEKLPLSAAQKNFRWALNKYYYTQKLKYGQSSRHIFIKFLCRGQFFISAPNIWTRLHLVSGIRENHAGAGNYSIPQYTQTRIAAVR